MWCFRYVSGWLAARDYFVCRGIRGGGAGCSGVPGMAGGVFVVAHG